MGSQRIIEDFDDDRFTTFIVTGKNGAGKSSYCNCLISEVYSARQREKYGGDGGTTCNFNLDIFKTHMGYHPKKVITQWKQQKERDYCYHWDDAGVWLCNLDFSNPFVKSIGRYLQVARTKWAVIMFSCIDKADIISKIRNFKSCIIVDITYNGEPKSKYISHKYRSIAHGYHYWEDRSEKFGGIEYDWEEEFCTYMPKTFYPWYIEQRKKYTDLQLKLMYDKMKEQRDIMKYRDTSF